VISDSIRIATVLVEENFEKIQSILFETTGMGNTGESYAVGTDYYMRSHSRFITDRAPLTIKVETEASKKAFSGAPGLGILHDYRGEKVLSAYRMINNKDLQWSIISEIDWNEAMEPIIRLRYYLIGITLFVVLLTVAITYFLSNAVAAPILQLKEIIVLLSKGIVPAKKFDIDTRDEIGQIANAIDQLTEGMKRTTTFANAIGSGDFISNYTALSDQDTLGLALIRMRDELRTFSEREMKLARSRTALLLEGQENERRRITQELHDGVGQLLTAIRMRVEMLEIESSVKEEIKTQINATVNEVKRISYNVMPQAIVDYGLEAALRDLCSSIKKYSSFSIDFRYIREHEHKLNFEISIAVFRIIQEGLNNIIKHAGAENVNLHVLDKETEIYVILEDNGQGFTEKDVLNSTGFGLRNIRERAKLLNGTAEIQGVPGQGTFIEIHIPIPKDEK
jgi:signal transduction histidine kinase